MKKSILLTMALSMAGLMSCAAQDKDSGSLTVNLPAEYTASDIVVSHALLNDMLANGQRNMKVMYDTIAVADHKAVMPLDPAGPSRYAVTLSEGKDADFYAQPGETIVMDVATLTPLNYTVSGTPLMEGMTKLSQQTAPIEEEFAMLSQQGNATEEQVQALYDKYDAAVQAFVKDNLNSPAATFALINIGGQDFLDIYEALGPDARTSILMPFVEKRRERAIKEAEGERFQKSLASGEIVAPDFTLPDLEGKMVSLSDFKGQWVVIDFWGSWCGWCIKGFPKLKETYKKYDGKFQVVGVDCRDPEASWRAAVAKYELPWINVYNAEKEGGVLEAYMVTGFPTKAIVNPDGKLVDITVGEDPAFYDKLARFIGEK